MRHRFAERGNGRSAAAVAAIALGLFGCSAALDPGERVDDLTAAQSEGFERRAYDAGPYRLFALARHGPAPPGDARTVHVYIEGDGFAWATATRPSTNPTPRNPVALKLARRDPGASVVYLARPCQFVDLDREPGCRRTVWTTDRYAPDEVASIRSALAAIKRESGADRIGLNGYSGAGVLVLAMALERRDVAYVRTVAAALDPVGFTRHHGVTPFRRPVDVSAAPYLLANVPQRHYVGDADSIAPPELARAFLGPDRPCLEIRRLASAHEGPWPLDAATLGNRPRC